MNAEMDTLRTAYRDIVPLQEWLSRTLTAARDSQTAELLQQDDPQNYRHLLDAVFVGASEEVKAPCFTSSQHSSLKEVVLRAIERNLKKKSPVPNILCLGYCLRCTDTGAHTGAGNVEIVYPNSCVNNILSKPWQTLHKRLGDTLMLFMLQNTSLFLEVAPTCFVQLTGVPVQSLLSDKTLPRPRCTSATHNPTNQSKNEAQKGPKSTKHCNARIIQGSIQRKNVAQNVTHPAKQLSTMLAKSGRKMTTEIRQHQVEKHGRGIRRHKFDKVEGEKYDGLRKQAELYAKQRMDNIEQADALIHTEISKPPISMALVSNAGKMFSVAGNGCVETVVNETHSTAKCEMTRKRRLSVSSANSLDRTEAAINHPQIKRQKVGLNQSLQDNFSAKTALQTDWSATYHVSRKRKLSGDCSDKTDEIERRFEDAKRQKICSPDQHFSLSSTESGAYENMNFNNVHNNIDSTAISENLTDSKHVSTDITTSEVKPDKPPNFTLGDKTIEAEHKIKTLCTKSDTDSCTSIADKMTATAVAEMQLDAEVVKPDEYGETANQSSGSGHAGVEQSNSNGRLCIEKDGQTYGKGATKVHRMKPKSFKPFDCGLILPRHTYMYRKHPRETLARNDLLHRLALEAESLAALYQDIFVDTKVLKGEYIHIEQPSIEEWATLLKQRKSAECATAETSTCLDSNPGVNIESSCSDSAETVDTPCRNTISQQHSSFGHDTYLLRSGSTNRSRSPTYSGRNIALCLPNSGTVQDSAGYRDSILNKHSSFGHNTHFFSSNRCSSMPESETHNSACLSNGRIEQDSGESKDLFLCQIDSPYNTCFKEHFEGSGRVDQTDDGVANASQICFSDKEILLRQRRAMLLYCQTGNNNKLLQMNHVEGDFYNIRSDVRVDTKCRSEPNHEATVNSNASTACSIDKVCNTMVKSENSKKHVTTNDSQASTEPEIPVDDSVTVKQDQNLSHAGACVKSSQAAMKMVCKGDESENVDGGMSTELGTFSMDDDTKAKIGIQIDTKQTEGDANKSHSDKGCNDGVSTDSLAIEVHLNTDYMITSQIATVAEECVTKGSVAKTASSRQQKVSTDNGKSDETVNVKTDEVGDVKAGAANEIQEQGRIRIPAVRDVMPLLADFVENHRKCPYKSLLNQLCAANVGRRTDLPVLLHKHTPPRKVFLFLRRCLLKTCPPELFGTAGNRNSILKSVWKMLSAGRYDKLCLGQLMAGLKTSMLPWLQRCHGNSVRLHLLARLVYWLFTRYIFGLVRAFFYVTDTTFLKYRLLYYRQAVWAGIQHHGTRGLIESKTLKPLTETEASRLVTSEQSLGVSALRFLPKEKSLRPIVNMGYMDSQTADKNMSINKQLFSLHQVLSYIKEQKPSLLGFGKLGTDDIYQAWLQLRDKWQSLGRPKLYFVKTDISRCYDSIIQEKLYDVLDSILQKALSDDEVIVRKYMMTHASRGTVKTRFIRQVDALSAFDGDFVSFARDLVQQKNLQHVVLMDKVVYEHETLDSLLEKLHKHLFYNVVKIGNQYYLQQCGISQGAVISTLLCSFYYAHMEGSVFQVDPDDFLLRIVDDYLFISPDKERAQGFLHQMAAGFPQYNCHTNVEKILTNFPCHGFSSVEADWFPWCGKLFNTRTLEISVDYSRLRGIRIDDTITFDLSSHPGTVLQKKILFSAAQKCHPIYLDSRVNSRGQILTNLHRVCLLAAFKLHAYICQLPHTQRANNNTEFFIGVIQSIGSLVWWHYIKTRKAYPCVEEPPICKNSIMWMCFEACQQKLCRFPCQYSSLLKKLKKKKCLLERTLGRDSVLCLRDCLEPELPEDFQLML